MSADTWFILAWIVGGLIATRWTVGFFIDDMCCGKLDDPDEWLLASLTFIITVAGAPLIVPIGAIALITVGTIKVVSNSPLNKWVKWFYTLDRDKRKAMMQGEEEVQGGW